MSNQNKRGGMMLSVKIDLMKIQRELLFAGKNGAKYLDLTVFVDNQAGSYGDNGMVIQDIGKERRQAGEKGPILGNCRIINGAVAGPDRQQQGPPLAQQMNRQANQAQERYAPQPDDQDIPF